MNSIIDSISNEKIIDKSTILKNVSDNYNVQVNSNVICNYSNQISKNDFQGNAPEYYSLNNNYQQYMNKNTGMEGNYIQNYGNSDNNIDETLISQLTSSSNNDVSLKYLINNNDNNGINCYGKLICCNCNLAVPKNDGISRSDTNSCICNNVNMVYYENLLKNNSQVNGGLVDTSTPQSIMTSLSMGSPIFSNGVSKESLSLRKDDENIVESNNGIIVNQNCEFENSNNSNNIHNSLCNYNRNNILTVGNIMQNSSLLLSGYLNGTPTQSNSRKILARVRELWLSNIVDGLPRKIAAFILQRHGNQIPYDRQFWSYAYKTGRLHPAEEQVQRQLNEGVQCLNRFIKQLIKSCNIMREHMLRKQGNSISCNTRNSRSMSNIVYNNKQKITGMVNNSVDINEIEISGYINGNLAMTNEEMISVNNNNQRLVLPEGDVNKRKYNNEIISNGSNILNNQVEGMIDRDNIDIMDNSNNINLNYGNSNNMDNIHVANDCINNDDNLDDDDGQVAEIPLDLTDEYLAKWLDGKNALIIRKLVNGDKDVQAIDLPTSLNSDNLYRALRFGGLLVRIPPYNQKSYEYFNLLSPGRGDTRHTQLIIPDGERDIDVKKSRTSLALPDFLVEDIPLPKVCVFQIEAKLELLLLYRGCSSKRPHTKRGRTLNSTQNQQTHHNIQNNMNGINNSGNNNNNVQSHNLINGLSQSQIFINRMIGNNSNMGDMLINGNVSDNNIINSGENNEINSKENGIIMNSGSNVDSINGNNVSDSNSINIVDNNINDQGLGNIESISMKSKIIGDENYIYLPNKVSKESGIIGSNNNENIDLKDHINNSDNTNSTIVGNILVNNQCTNNNIQSNAGYTIIQDGEHNNIFEDQKDTFSNNKNNFSTQSTVFSTKYNSISPGYYENMFGIKKKCVDDTKLDYSCINGDIVTHPLTSTVCCIPQNDENSDINSQIESESSQINHLFQTYSQNQSHDLNINSLTYNQISLNSNNKSNNNDNSEYGYNIRSSCNDVSKSNDYYDNQIQNEIIYNHNDGGNNNDNDNNNNNNNNQEHNYLNVYSHTIFEINDGECDNIDNNNVINRINSYNKGDLVLSNNQDMFSNNINGNNISSNKNSNGNNVDDVQHPCLNWSLNIS
ncbi:hypothetical protein RS030_91526 [Cryptosporidium xiaoi]|uniref:Uncharacterized protein n=1 Tax=Cryptosporidium xiaoi TaxID=659607 RepID=A0AAV9XYQ1_9CRYT